MLGAFIACAVIFVVLLCSELLWRKKILKNENARKFVHILTAVWIAVWPLFLTLRTIQALSVLLLLVVLIAKKLKLFRSIRDIKRKSSGDFAYAIGIGLSALLASSGLFFSAAMLHVGLADGLAALVGQRYGRRNRYTVLGQPKSIAGTVAFTTVSLIILAYTFFIYTGSATVFLPGAILLALSLALVENMSPKGSDNIFVPLLLLLAVRAIAI